MKASEEHIDLFDRYFNGELSTRERLHLEETIKKDPVLEAAFNEYRDMVLGIEAVSPALIKASFSNIDTNIASDQLKPYSPQRTGKNKSKKERNWNIMMWLMIIGSGVLLVAFLFAVFNLPDLEEKLKKDKKRGQVEHVISEEVVENNCSMIACLPPSMFENYKQAVTVDDQGNSQRDFSSASFMVCPKSDKRDVSIEMLLSSSGDTIKLWNMPCDDIQLYFTPFNEEGILLACDTVLYHITENGYSVYQEPEQADTIMIETGEVDLDEEESKEDKSNGPSVSQDAEFGQNIYAWMSSQIQFPESAKTKQISGQVHIGFTIDENGMVQNPVIEKSLDPDFDAEVLRCVKLMPKWTPATVDGKPVSQKMTLPVKFTAPV